MTGINWPSTIAEVHATQVVRMTCVTKHNTNNFPQQRACNLLVIGFTVHCFNRQADTLSHRSSWEFSAPFGGCPAWILNRPVVMGLFGAKLTCWRTASGILTCLHTLGC